MDTNDNAEQLSDDDFNRLIDDESNTQQRPQNQPKDAIQKQVVNARQTEQALQKTLRETPYPDNLQLGEYVLGLLDEETSARIEHLIQSSPVLKQRYEEAKAYLNEDLFLNETVDEAEQDITKDNIIHFARLAKTETKLKVAGNNDQSGPLHYEIENRILLLDIQKDYQQNRILVGQLIADDLEQWAKADVTCFVGGKAQASFRMSDLATFDTMWDVTDQFSMMITATSGDVIMVTDINFDD